jgi:MFS transporter, putative metabolite transport protein
VPLEARRTALLIYANAGLFCDGYILSSIGPALISLAPHFRLDAVTTGLIGAMTLLGILIGAPVVGHVTDRFGRRILMIADLGVFVVASVAQLFVTQVWELIALRFVLGVAIGADYPIAGALIAEHVPARVRGAAVNSMQVAWFFGAAVAYAAGYALSQHAGNEGWKWILASPAVFAAIGLLLRASAPESPLWLAARAAGDLERESFATIFGPRYRGALAFVSAMWLLQVVPLFAIYTFAPAVLAAFGLNGSASPAGGVAITSAFLAGSLVSLPLVESWGRRPLCVAGFAIGVAAFGTLLVTGALVVACFVAYAIGIGAAAGLELTYPNELFPTPIRATATGFAAAVSRIGAFFGTFGLPWMLARYGVAFVVGIALALSAAGLLLALRWAPETRGALLT